MYVQVGRPDGGFSTPATSASAPLLSAVVNPVPRAFHHPPAGESWQTTLKIMRYSTQNPTRVSKYDLYANLL